MLGVHTDGGMRPRFIVPARKLHPSKQLTLEQLALVETLAIGCHAVNRGSPQPGEHVLVIGAGPIGLSVLEFVKLTGATITVLDLNPQRLDFCQQHDGRPHTVQLSATDRSLDGAEGLDRGALARRGLRRHRQPEVDVQRLQLRRPHRPAGVRRHHRPTRSRFPTRCCTAGR